MTGEELRQLIKGAGMSLTDMAKELGITPQNLNARLNRRSVKYEFVKASASHLVMQMALRSHRCTSIQIWRLLMMRIAKLLTTSLGSYLFIIFAMWRLNSVSG